MNRIWAATIANVAQDAGCFPSSRALVNRDRLLLRETIVNPGTHTANGTASALAVYSAIEIYIRYFMRRVIGGASWRLLPDIRETNGRKSRKDSLQRYARNFDSYVIFLLRPVILYNSMYYGVRYFDIDLIFINPILFRNIYLLRIRTKSIVSHELIRVFVPRFDLFALVFLAPISDIINRAFNITGIRF